MPNAAIILAGGRGQRACDPPYSLPKQLRPLAGEAVFLHSLAPFLNHPQIERIILVIPGDLRSTFTNLLGTAVEHVTLVDGGDTRKQSTTAGLAACSGFSLDNVLIHDAARPFVQTSLLDRLISQLETHSAVIPIIPVTDTVKRIHDHKVLETVPRHDICLAQTPQAFRYDLIHNAHLRAMEDHQMAFTDDASLIEWIGHTVHTVPGDPDNTKLTTPHDFSQASSRFSHRWSHGTMETRTGQGFDAHQFSSESEGFVALCGVRIQYERSLAGHSDADVGLHALTDALLGAMGDRDIGYYFPPTDRGWKALDSMCFFHYAIEKLASRGGRVVHLDVTLICEEPKIGPHRKAMQARISEIAHVSTTRVSIKATTTERMGFTGRGEGIAALATATIRIADVPEPSHVASHI